MTSSLRFLGLGLVGSTLSGSTVMNATEKTRNGTFGLPSSRNQVWRSLIDNFHRVAPLGTDPGRMDKDVTVELFLENGVIKTPYERCIAFMLCTLNRWSDPNCIPGIGSKIFTDKEMTDAEMHDSLMKSLSKQNDKCYSTFTRPYILAIHGNDQYVMVYPHTEEIGPDHQHRKLVEQHFAERGFQHLAESLPIDWDKLYERRSRKTTGSNPIPCGRDQEVNNLRDIERFRDRVLSGFGIPREFFANKTSITHWTKTENSDSGEPTC